jgi:hypothetical protein
MVRSGVFLGNLLEGHTDTGAAMGALSWRRSLAVVVVLVLLVLTLGPQVLPTRGLAQLPQGPRTLAPSVGVVGTYGCSARACHGGLEPLLQTAVLQNEHTTWLLRDKHANAYRVLFDERSKLIARNLGGKAPAHEDVRCLACHTNPQTAALEGSPAVLEERIFGVGCESCHGPAEKWLAPHTRPDWKKLPAEQKRAQGMVPVSDLASRVQACTGCHVGAAPEGTAPLRDVNHDLIAAGHPRLHFEYAAFQAHMPPHWTIKAEEKKSTYPTQSWAIGQLASAQAALRLLHHRADHPTQPWPEFAEYDCFACHHALQEPSNRQQQGYGKRLPGSFPWGTWYLSVPGALAAPAVDGDPEFRAALEALQKLMMRPYPNRQAVAQQARDAAAQLDGWLRKWGQTPTDSAKLIRFLVRDELRLAETSWDSAAQLYLGLIALEQSQPNERVQTALRELAQKQAFPALHDSPGDAGAQEFRAGLSKLLQQLRQ